MFYMGTKRSLDTRQETQITPFDHVFRRSLDAQHPVRSRNLQFLCPADETSKAQPNVALMKSNEPLHRMAEINECF